MDGTKGAAVREGDEAGPSRPKKAKQDTLVSGEPCLDDKTLHEVAERLADKWVTLAVKELSFTMPQVKVVEKNNENNLTRQGLEMLAEWKQAQSTSVEQQVNKLYTALNNIGRADIAGLLPGVSHTQKTAETGPDHLKILQQLLISYYEAHAGFIPEIVTSSMLPALGVDEFYIHLNLLQSGKQTTREDVKMSGQTKSLNRAKTKQLKIWEDMYDEKKVGEKMVLLSGGAGFGKSTLCGAIANTWEKRKESKVGQLRKGSNISKFELLFLLKLSQFKTSCVIDAIFDQLLQRTDKLTKSDVKKVISDNEDKVAFLMDGLDEIPRHILQSAKGVYPIKLLLENKLLLNSCVLVTTRPDMVPYVIQGYRGYARVETKGFTVDKRDKFMKAHFPSNITPGEDLISWLESHQSIQELSKSPIIARMLCLLWRNRPDPSKPLPDKLTTVCTKFAKVLVERRFSTLSDADRQQVMYKILKGLGQVALEGLLDGERLNFSPEDFRRDESVLKGGCQMGILQTETVPSDVENVEVVTFLHKSHLEYCVAHYLISLLDSDEQSFRRCIDKIIALGVSKVEYVLRFCCGLSKQAAALILSRVGHGDDNVARLCLFESGSKRLASKLRPPSKISCDGQQDLVALHYYLESGIKLKWTVFKITCHSCADLRVLGDIVRCCKSDIRSMTIDCVLWNQGNEMLRLLAETLQAADMALLNKKLLGIEVNILDGEIVDAKRVAECISHLPNQLWMVCVSEISHDYTCALVDALKGCKLHGLRANGVNMHSHVARLGPLVTPSLKVLCLNECGLDDTDVEGVVSLLPNGHGLTEIFLVDNAFSLNAVKTLVGRFQDLCNLTFLAFQSDDDDVEPVWKLDLPQLEQNYEIRSEGINCDSYQEVQQLQQTLRSGVVDPTEGITIWYNMSERWREELERLEETFGLLDERLRGQTKLTVDVDYESVADVEWLAGCISRLSNQVERFNLHMVLQSPSYVTGLLNALTEGRSFSRLVIYGTNMHGHVRDLASLVTPSLEELTLDHCDLDDDDMTDLTHILDAAQYLVELDVSNNGFSIRAVEGLTIYLQSFQYLHDLRLQNNYLNYDLVNRVVKENPPNV